MKWFSKVTDSSFFYIVNCRVIKTILQKGLKIIYAMVQHQVTYYDCQKLDIIKFGTIFLAKILPLLNQMLIFKG